MYISTRLNLDTNFANKAGNINEEINQLIAGGLLFDIYFQMRDSMYSVYYRNPEGIEA